MHFIGVDVAEGSAGGDYSVAVCIEQVDMLFYTCDILRGQFPLNVFSLKLLDFAKKYNSPPVLIERNNHGHAIIIALVSAQYNNIQYAAADHKAGFATNVSTKPLLIGNLETALREQTLRIRHQIILDELSAYQYLDGSTKGVMGAPSGAHDDCVIALALAWQCSLWKRQGSIAFDFV